MPRYGLKQATDAYWAAQTPREQQAAYHEMLLFGGKDGFGSGGWREFLARWLRKVALKIET